MSAESRDVIDLLAGIEPGTGLDGIRARRVQWEKDPGAVLNVLKDGTARANAVAEETLTLAKKAIKQDFFPRRLEL